MQFPPSFLSKDSISRLRALVSFSMIVRWGFIAMLLFSLGVFVLDIFIFYRYSYRVVNLNPEPVVRSITIDREGLRGALEVLDARRERFKTLYGGGTTTPR
ncbi:MAG: hypothetical protein Q7R73_01975 [bacterium]|nr:hypothetical protein [bacterium]